MIFSIEYEKTWSNHKVFQRFATADEPVAVTTSTQDCYLTWSYSNPSTSASLYHNDFYEQPTLFAKGNVGNQAKERQSFSRLVIVCGLYGLPFIHKSSTD